MRFSMTCTIISDEKKFDIFRKNESIPLCNKIKTMLLSEIWQLYCRGYDRFWLNCEWNIPMWCAEIITAMKMYNDIRLYIAMPYEEQASGWDEKHRELFFDVHADADKVIMISDYYTKDCFHLADMHMINNSDRVLIIGNDRAELFGSKYAVEHDIPVEYMFK